MKPEDVCAKKSDGNDCGIEADQGRESEVLKAAEQEEESDGEKYEGQKYCFDRRKVGDRCSRNEGSDGTNGGGNKKGAHGGDRYYLRWGDEGEPDNRENDEYVVHGRKSGIGVNTVAHRSGGLGMPFMGSCIALKRCVVIADGHNLLEVCRKKGGNRASLFILMDVAKLM